MEEVSGYGGADKTSLLDVGVQVEVDPDTREILEVGWGFLRGRRVSESFQLLHEENQLRSWSEIICIHLRSLAVVDIQA